MRQGLRNYMYSVRPKPDKLTFLDIENL